jgi:hypothetical protein
MSTNNWDTPEITPELIERSMKQARIERSKAVWSLLQRLFSQPETGETADNDFALRPKLRLG